MKGIFTIQIFSKKTTEKYRHPVPFSYDSTNLYQTVNPKKVCYVNNK